MSWISVDKDLPKHVTEDGVWVYPYVLMYLPYHDPIYQIGYHDGETWNSTSDYEVSGVTHWMRLEEPWKIGKGK